MQINVPDVPREVMIIMPDETYHDNKIAVKVVREKYGAVEWNGISEWTNRDDIRIRTFFSKAYAHSDRTFEYGGNVFIVETTNIEFIHKLRHVLYMTDATFIDMTKVPHIDVMIDGISAPFRVKMDSLDK